MLATILTLMAIILDQAAKFLAVKYLKGEKPFVIIKNAFSLVYVENRGAAFGILQGRKIFFVVITVITAAVLIGFLFKNYKTLSKWNIVSLSFILGGAIGNFIDRIRLNYVVDFISLKFFNKYNFAVFNLADSFIVVGAIMLILYILIVDSKGKKNEV